MKFSSLTSIVLFYLLFTYRWQGLLHLVSEDFLPYFFSRMTSLRSPESHFYQRCPHPIVGGRVNEEWINLQLVFCITLIQLYKTLQYKAKFAFSRLQLSLGRALKILRYVRYKHSSVIFKIGMMGVFQYNKHESIEQKCTVAVHHYTVSWLVQHW